MRGRCIRLAFAGDERRSEEFLRHRAGRVPKALASSMRGSSVTACATTRRAVDADGPATSDLDSRSSARRCSASTSSTAFYLPGVHTSP